MLQQMGQIQVRRFEKLQYLKPKMNAEIALRDRCETELPKKLAGSDRESGIAHTRDLWNSLISRELLLVSGHSGYR